MEEKENARRLSEWRFMNSQAKLLLSLFFASMVAYLALMPFITFPLTVLLKPLPIIVLIILVCLVAKATSDRTWLFIALGFSLLGDIALTSHHPLTIPAGMLCFMLAHCAYIRLFITDFHFQAQRLIIFVPFLLLIFANYLFLVTNMADMAIPAFVYGTVLVAMVFTATQVQQQVGLIITGACLFLLSDGLLGMYLFKWHYLALIMTVMVIYYVAQLLLTIGILQRGNVGGRRFI